jgi:TPR repeat protein
MKSRMNANAHNEMRRELSRKGFQFAKQTAGVVCLSICLGLTTGYAQPSKTNSPEQSIRMETNIVDEAMALIRQRKFSEAREILLPVAEKGQAESQALLGQIYNAGWGVPVNYEQAFKWWSRAADGGSTDAQWGLGLLYDDGKGVARDSKKAAMLWKRAAERGNIKATINLAFLYEEGRGVERDLKECARLFKLAAEAGDPGAQLNYGLKLLNGEGVEQNQVLGCAWIGVAAESPRTKGSGFAEKIQSQKDKTWRNLSAENNAKAEKLKKEILSRIKAD